MTESLPLVSIVTPSFNQALFLRETIESVLAQDYPHVEYIVMDGGSTDGSVEIIREYESRLGYWQSERDGGQSDAINKGWQRAGGEIVSYLNSDDTLNPNAVRLSVEALTKHPKAGLSYGACAWIDAKSNRIGMMGGNPFTLPELLLQNRLAQPTVFVRRRALEHVGRLDESLHYLMDYDMWLRVALKYPTVCVPHTLANFRLHDDSKTASRYRLFLEDNLRLIGKTFDAPDFPAQYAPLRPRAINYAYLLTALHCYGLGNIQDGREIIQHWFETQSAPLANPEDIISLFANHLVHIAPMRQGASEPPESVARGTAWLATVLNDLPPTALALRAFRSKILSQANLAWGFAAHARRDAPRARTHMLHALAQRPSTARNRGVWSVLLKSTWKTKNA